MCKRLITVFFLGLLIPLSPLKVSAQAPQTQAPFLAWTINDAAYIFGNIDGKTILYGAGALGLVSLLTVLDEPVRSLYDTPTSSGFIYNFTEATNLLGEPPVALSATLGILGLSLLTKNYKFQDAAFTSAQSLAYATATSLVLKHLIGRNRPGDSGTPYTFGPFTGNDSFTSGHATAAFSILIPWAMYYPGPLTWSLVGIAAGGTAYARIVKNKHWFSDVVGGGLLGFTFGYVLSRRHQFARATPTDFLSSLNVTPLLFPGNQGLSISLVF